MRISEVDILVQPGLGNSGPGHWQRRWGERFSTARFIEQADWDDPQLDDWVERIEQEVARSRRPAVVIAHSLGVLALVHAAQRFPDMAIRGAFLVAPPDHEADLHAEVAQKIARFADVPREPLPFPSLLVMSSNDPFGSAEHAADKAAAWGAELHIAGEAGHINIDSGHGPWPEGLLMFTRLMQRLRA